MTKQLLEEFIYENHPESPGDVWIARLWKNMDPWPSKRYVATFNATDRDNMWVERFRTLRRARKAMGLRRKNEVPPGRYDNITELESTTS